MTYNTQIFCYVTRKDRVLTKHKLGMCQHIHICDSQLRAIYVKQVITVQTFDWQIDYYGVRLRLWTAATGGHVVHSTDDMSVESDGGMILTG
jgi:hypothetical protein